MGYINYNMYDMMPMQEATRLLEKLGGECVEDEELWAYSRQSEDIPTFENDIYELTCARIERLMDEKYPDVKFTYDSNARASWFYIEHDENRVFEDFDSVE